MMTAKFVDQSSRVSELSSAVSQALAEISDEEEDERRMGPASTTLTRAKTGFDAPRPLQRDMSFKDRATSFKSTYNPNHSKFTCPDVSGELVSDLESFSLHPPPPPDAK